MKKLLFEEHQIQRRGLPWLIVLLIWSLSIYQISIEKFSEENLFVDIFLLIAMPLIVSLLLYMLKLSVIITPQSIMYRMFPFQRTYRNIRLDQVNHAFLLEYNDALSFHGWGFRISLTGKYRSYTVKGYKGVELVLKNDKTIFLGSGRANELLSLINLLKSNLNSKTS